MSACHCACEIIQSNAETMHFLSSLTLHNHVKPLTLDDHINVSYARLSLANKRDTRVQHQLNWVYIAIFSLR